MNPSSEVQPTHRRAGLLALLLCLVFVVQGLIFIPRVPVQNDEVLFGAALLKPVVVEHQVRLFRRNIPTMVMSYVGALKAWLYYPVFQLWGTSNYAIRVPVLIAGALTIWLLYLLLRDTVGGRVAIAASALLATDSTYLLTTTLDWGPVALQHLLLLAGMLLLLRFHKSGDDRLLGVGFFCFGLGLWDKTIFVWLLVGLGAATLVVFPRQTKMAITRRRAAIAVVALLLGALPLLQYNKARRMNTVSSNVHFTTEGLADKVHMVRYSLQGDSLFGYIVPNEPPDQVTPPSDGIERFSVWLSEATARPQVGLSAWAVLLAVVLLPFLWRSPARQPMLFALVLMIAAWLQMALNRNTGGGSHHVVLLWPFPQVLAAAALVQVCERLTRARTAVLVSCIGLIAGSNLLVTNQYLAQVTQWGTTIHWTDAVYPLSRYMDTVGAQRIQIMDWGMFESLRVLNRGRLPLFLEGVPAAPDQVRELLSRPGTVFVAHAPGAEMPSSLKATLDSAAAQIGFRKETLQVIPDRHRRPIFEVYRYHAAQ